MLQGNTKHLPLQNIFQTLALNQQEGILSITFQKLERFIAIRKTGISLLCERSHSSRLLQSITTRLKILTANEYENVFDTTSVEAPPGDVLIERHVLNPDTVGDIVREQFQEYLYEIFEWSDASYRFDVRDIPADRLIFGNPEMAQRMDFPVNGVLMEVAHREDEWNRIRDLIPSQHQIHKFVASPPDPEELRSSVSLSDERLQALFTLIDGARTVEDIVESSRIPPFYVFGTMRWLLESNVIYPITLDDKKNLADKLRQKFQMEKVANVYRSILDENPEETEIRKKLALQLERKNPGSPELVPHYRVLARQTYQERDMASCQQYLEKILEIASRDLDAVELLVLVHAHSKKDRAMGLALRDYTSIVRKHREFERGAAFVLSLSESREVDGWVLQEAAHLFLLAGNPQAAATYYEKAAKLFIQAGDTRRVAKVVEKLEVCDSKAAARWRRQLEWSRPDRSRTWKRIVALLLVAAVILLVCSLGYEVDARITYADVLKSAEKSATFGDLDHANLLLDDFYDRHPYTMVRQRVTVDKKRLERQARRREANDTINRHLVTRPGGGSTDGTEMLLSRGMAMQNLGQYAEALEHYRSADLAGRVPAIVARIKKQIDFLDGYLAAADALYEKAQRATGNGELHRVNQYMMRILNEYPFSPRVAQVRLPVQLDVRPPSARVTVNGKPIDGPPYRLWAFPAQEPAVSVEAEGFVGQVHSIDPRRGSLVLIRLQKKALWTLVFPGFVEAEPCIAGGRIYLGNRSGQVLAHDARTGEILWRFQLEGLGDCVGSIRQWQDDVLFVGTDAALYRVDGDTGQLVYRKPLQEFTRAPISAPDDRGRVFVATTRGNLMAVRAEDGALLWNRLVGGVGEFPPVAARGVVATVSRAGHLTVLDAATGKRRWVRELGGVVTTPPARSGRHLLVGLGDRRLICLDIETGDVVWTRRLSHAATGHLEPLPNNRLAVVTRGGLLLALDMASGGSRWEIQLDGTYSQGPRSRGDIILVVNQEGQIDCFDTEGGSHFWSYHSHSQPSSPLVVGEEIVFVADQNRRVHAISTDYR